MSSYEFSAVPRPVPSVSTDHRLIQTDIPAPGTAERLARLDAVEARSMHGGLPIVWSEAYDYQVGDLGENQFIDFTSGIFVANVGHANEAVWQAIKTSGEDDPLHSYTYATEIRARYLERLTKWSGFDKGFLLSSGTEATEAALKLMRLYGVAKGKRRGGILCFEGAFHGRTLGAAMMSGSAPPDANVHILPFPYPWGTKAPFDDAFHQLERQSYARGEGLHDIDWGGLDPKRDVCGVMLETFQGWCAAFYPPAYVQAIAAFCKKHDILLCFDEMQAGFGRTGRKFGYEHYGVTPDLICVGKGMGGGVPLSGVLGRREVMDLPGTGDMSSTHGGNPMACAAGLAVIEEMERLDLVREAARKGELLHAAMRALKSKNVTYVLGKGLVAAVLFETAEFASRVAERCYEKGVLIVHTGRESAKLGPALTIPDAALLEGVQVLGEAIAEVGA